MQSRAFKEHGIVVFDVAFLQNILPLKHNYSDFRLKTVFLVFYSKNGPRSCYITICPVGCQEYW